MRKTRLTIFLVMMGLVTYSQNQPERTKKSSTLLGFQVGLTSTIMYGDQIELELDDPGAKYVKERGLEIALRVKHEFNPLLYLKSGLGYYQRDGQVEGSRIIYATQGPFNFLQIPIIFGIQPINMQNSGGLNLGFESGLSLNHLVSSDDNLEKGLHPDNVVERKLRVPSFQLGFNLEVPIKTNMIFNINYQYSKDLTYYFNRRYTWYSSQTEKEVSHDYDLWFKSNSISVGLLFNMNPRLPNKILK